MMQSKAASNDTDVRGPRAVTKLAPGVAIYGVLGLMVLGVLLPLAWMIISGLKSYREVFDTPWGLPAAPQWQNYIKAWQAGVSTYIGNSVFVTLLSLALVLVVSAAGAYAISLLRMPGANVLSLIVIGGMMLAPPVAIVPLYSLFQTFGMLDNLAALSVLYAAYRIPISLFIIRAYMLSMPREIIEAASVDGCGSFRTWWHVVLPMCRPAVISAGIMHLLFAWNEFPFALTLLSSGESQTLAVGLLNLRGDISTDWPVVFAGMVIAAVPMVAVYLSGQRHFIRGVADGSIKA